MTNPVVRWISFGNLDAASSRLRVYIPINVLLKRGWDTGIFKRDDFHKTDIIIFQKRYSAEDIILAEEFKLKGKKVIFDLCDNHFYNPDRHPALVERASRLDRMILSCDAVIASSNELKKFINHPNVVKIDDAVESFQLNQIKKFYYDTFKNVRTKGKISLAWFGNSGSLSPPFGMVDLGKIIPVLNDINETTEMRLNVFSDSIPLYKQYVDGAAFESRFYKWEKHSFPYLFSQHQLCLIPISKNPFTVCKTSNRLITALQLGVPVIADKIPSYEEFGEYVNFSNWKENITKIAAGRDEDEKVAQGQHYIRKHYNEETLYSQWSDFLRKV